jgi:hypothetical protein
MGLWVGLLLAFGGNPAGASSFGRLGIEDLVAGNELIVTGEVLETHSYWTEPGTLILTEVRFAVSEVLKGEPGASEIKVTLPGGRIGDRANVVVGGADLAPERSYLLFLRRGDLPGAKGVRMVADFGQGAFEIRLGKGGLRAVSQATRDTLIANAIGDSSPLGGADGLSLDALRSSVHDLVGRGGRKEPN